MGPQYKGKQKYKIYNKMPWILYLLLHAKHTEIILQQMYTQGVMECEFAFP